MDKSLVPPHDLLDLSRGVPPCAEPGKERTRAAAGSLIDKVATALENNVNEKFDGLKREVSLVTQRCNHADKAIHEHTTQIDDILKKVRCGVVDLNQPTRCDPSFICHPCF